MKHQDIIRRLSLAQKCSILSGQDTWSTRPMNEPGIPVIILSDGPSGVRRQLGAGDQLGLNESEKSTCFPSAATIANSWDLDLAEKVGETIGREAAALGVDVLLGPGLNIKRSPTCGRNFEYFSEDPYLSGKMAAAYIRGIQSRNVSACPKHFAANSQELHRMASDSVLDERTLRELYLTNFEIAVKEGKPKSLMTSYNRVNGIYANENPMLLQEILRNEWGFDGFVVTDWGGSNDFVDGIKAGCNLEMPGTGTDSPRQMMEAVEAGKITEAELGHRVDELLDMIFWASKREKTTADMTVHHDIARGAAAQSIVMLKNDEDILPLKKDMNIVVIGDFADVPRYQGAGSSMVNPFKLGSALDALKETFSGEIKFARGFHRADTFDESLAAQAATMAESADAVLMYMGLPEVFEAEGMDRKHMRIPQNQIKVLEAVHKANPNIVVVFSGGSAVEMPWLDHCKALLWTGLGGQAGMEALPSILLGSINPGGKLAETFPIRYEDLPVSHYFPGKELTCEYREGLFAGYRYTETVKADTLFPFGFGLSYTSFRYDNIEATNERVNFDITNTGKRAGAEIAQLYVSPLGGEVARPAKELKGFAKVYLEPNETKRVTIALDDKAFRYFNTDTGRFEIECGAWLLQIGASVKDIRLSSQIMVSGNNAKVPRSATAAILPRNLLDVTDAEFEALLGHKIPPSQKPENTPLTMNDPIDSLVNARNPLARCIIGLLLKRREKSIESGQPDLNILFMTNMPFRGIAKMLGGKVTLQMAEDLVTLANSRGLRGLGRFIKHFFTRPKQI